MFCNKSPAFVGFVLQYMFQLNTYNDVDIFTVTISTFSIKIAVF